MQSRADVKKHYTAWRISCPTVPLPGRMWCMKPVFVRKLEAGLAEAQRGAFASNEDVIFTFEQWGVRIES